MEVSFATQPHEEGSISTTHSSLPTHLHAIISNHAGGGHPLTQTADNYRSTGHPGNITFLQYNVVRLRTLAEVRWWERMDQVQKAESNRSSLSFRSNWRIDNLNQNKQNKTKTKQEDA
jgi:hypothetical protein